MNLGSSRAVSGTLYFKSIPLAKQVGCPGAFPVNRHTHAHTQKMVWTVRGWRRGLFLKGLCADYSPAGGSISDNWISVGKAN